MTTTKPRPTNPLEKLAVTLEEYLRKFMYGEKDLLDLLESVSMSFTANTALRGFQDLSDVIEYFNNQSGTYWNFEFADITGLRLRNITCKIEDDNQRPTVLSTLQIESFSIETAEINSGAELVIPLTAHYHIISFATADSGFFSQLDYHPYFRLATSIERACLSVYGYIVEPDGSLTSLTPDDTLAGDFLDRIEKNTLQGMTSDSIVLLVTVEFVFCQPKADFDPFGGAYVARCYPLVSYWSTKPLDKVTCAIDFIRPTHSDLGMGYKGGELVSSFYTDRNYDEPLSEVELPAPTWDILFDHYRLLGTNSDGFEAVGNRSERINTASRKIRSMELSADGSRPPTINKQVQTEITPVKKLPRQGVFDNVHIAPAMEYEGMPVYMAPICHHDCLHMHWRWSSGFFWADQTKGWSPAWPADGGPNTIPGTPMIPPNQTLHIEPLSGATGVGVRYLATATKVDFGLRPASARWNIFCHHGFGYVVKLAFTTEVGLFDMLYSGDIGKAYHMMRYLVTEEGEYLTRVYEETFHLFEDM